MHNLISKAVESHSLNAEELLELLKNDAINPELFAAAGLTMPEDKLSSTGYYFNYF